MFYNSYTVKRIYQLTAKYYDNIFPSLPAKRFSEEKRGIPNLSENYSQPQAYIHLNRGVRFGKKLEPRKRGYSEKSPKLKGIE